MSIPPDVFKSLDCLEHVTDAILVEDLDSDDVRLLRSSKRITADEGGHSRSMTGLVQATITGNGRPSTLNSRTVSLRLPEEFLVCHVGAGVEDVHVHCEETTSTN